MRAELVEGPVEAELLLGPQAPDRLDALLEAWPALPHRRLERLELVGQEGAGEADVQAAVREVVEHGELARQLDRVVERRDDRPGDQPHPPGPLGGGGQEGDRVRAVAAPRGEIVLDRLDVAVAELLGLLAKLEALVVEGRTGLLVRRDRGEEVDPELHTISAVSGSPSGRPSRPRRKSRRRPPPAGAAALARRRSCGG